MTRKTDQSRVSEETGHERPRSLRMNLRQLQVFVATARAGSTRAAAERVSRSQSAASSTLAELEAALGVQLFERVGRRLLLNENGRALLPRATALLDEADELQHLFDDGHAAPLRIAASLTIGEYLMPQLLAAWKVEHPASPVQMRIANSSDVIAAVAAFDADLGFIEGPQTHPDLVVRPWLADELTIVAAPGHPLSGGPATSRQLQEASWALRERGSGTREAADRWLLEHLGPLHVEFELGSAESLKRLVAAGAAIGCLSRRAVAAEIAQGTLVELRTRLPRGERRLALVMHRDKRLGRGARAFAGHCEALAASTAGGRAPARRPV